MFWGITICSVSVLSVIGLVIWLRLSQRYRRAFDSSPDPIYIVDAQTHHVIAANRAATQAYGASLSALRATRWEDWHQPTKQATQESFSGRWQQRASTGAIAEVELTSYPMRFGRREAVAVVARPVPESRTGIAELASFVSHDLRNPLSVVIAYSHLLTRTAKTGAFDARTQKQIDGIRRAADRMDFMIQNIVDVAKLETGRFILEIKSEDLASIVTEALDAVNALVAEKSIDFKVDLSDAIIPLLVKVDHRRMVHAFRSVLHNAVKFTPNGGQVSVRAGLGDEGVEFVVKDDGPGIPADLLPKIFECSWRTKVPNKPHSGLSLFVTRNIVESHGGRVDVESAPGRGSTFRIVLPLKAVAVEPEAGNTTDEQTQSTGQ